MSAKETLPELRAHIERLQTVADNVPAMLAYWDSSERCQFANRAYEEWFGVSPAEVMGKSMLALLGERLYGLNKPYIDGALRGETQLFERTLTDTKGEVRYTQASYVPDVQAGKVLGFYVLVTDITSRKRYEEALREREASFRVLLEAAPDAMVIIDSTGKLMLLNAQTEKLFGYGRQELIGSDLGMLLPERYRAPHTEHLRKYLAAPEPRPMGAGLQLWARHKSGTEFPIEVALSPVENLAGLRVIAAVRDVSERKHVETSLVESRAQLQALLDAVPDYIFALDRDGKIMFANRSLRYPLDVILGAPALGFFPEHARDAAREAIEAALGAGRVSNFETSVMMGASKLWFTCQVSPVLREGKKDGALILARDVTEKKRVATQLAAAERLAAVGTLAAGVAHEINTPVQFASHSIEFLRDASAELLETVDKLLALQSAIEQAQPVAAAAAEAKAAIDQADMPYLLQNIPLALERSAAGLRRVAEIVRSLRAFAHPDENEMVEADLHTLIENTLTIAVHEYKYVADIVRDFGELPPVRCHAGGISQVILNLVVNAAHAIAERIADSKVRGQITVSTRREPGHVTIAVADTGTGVPESVRSRVFDPFFTTKAVGKGTGQGLAIAWTIITEEHHGELWFDTEVGVGTTFHFRIPIEPPAQ